MAQASGQKFAMMTGPGHIYISCIGTGEDLREYIESRYSIDLFLIMKLQFGSCLLVVPTVMLYRAIGRHGAGANQLARWIYRIKESPYINIIPCTILYGFFVYILKMHWWRKQVPRDRCPYYCPVLQRAL